MTQDLGPMHSAWEEPPFEEDHHALCPANEDPDRVCECDDLEAQEEEEAHEMREDAKRDRFYEDGGLE